MLFSHVSDDRIISKITECLTSGEPCFLEAEEWQSIPDGLIDFPLLPKTPELYHGIFGLFAKVPGLVKRAKRVTDHSLESERLSILSSAEKVRRDLNQWHRQFATTEKPSPDPCHCESKDASYGEDMFRSAYFYKDVASASVITTYCAYSIVLNDAIGKLFSADTLRSEEIKNFELARNICWSVDFCSKAGYCGTQVMRFSLPIARGALPAGYHGWIDDWIRKFQSAHDASRIQPRDLH